MASGAAWAGGDTGTVTGTVPVAVAVAAGGRSSYMVVYRWRQAVVDCGTVIYFLLFGRTKWCSFYIIHRLWYSPETGPANRLRRCVDADKELNPMALCDSSSF